MAKPTTATAHGGAKDSHLSTGGAHQPPGPTRQHHRMALGKEKVTGMAKPNGDAIQTGSKIGNAPKTY